MANNSLEVISEVLDKMIDLHAVNSQAIGSLKNLVEHMSESVKKTEGHFTNGFKSEIKGHISIEAQKLVSQINEVLSRMDAVIDRIDSNHDEAVRQITNVQNRVEGFAKPRFWVKLAVAALTAIITIAGASAALVQIMKVDRNSTANSVNADHKSQPQ